MNPVKYLLAKKLANLIRYRNEYRLGRLIKKGFVRIGAHTYGWENIHIRTFTGCKVEVEIGKFCSIAENLLLIEGGIHPVERITTYPLSERFLPRREAYMTEGMPSTKGKITIGNDVWIAGDVTILSGVTIGDGAVIACGAVVTNDVPPYALYGGIPAKLIKFRFSEPQIRGLLHIRWWDWDEAKIKANLRLLSSADLDTLLREQSFEPESSSTD